MKVKALDLKNWTTANISPLAWKRIVLRALPEINAQGYELESMEEPAPGLELSGALLNHIFDCVYDMYKIEIPQSVLVAN